MIVQQNQMDVEGALAYLSAVELPEAPLRSRDVMRGESIPLKSDEPQSLIVGSGIVSFSEGLSKDQRAIVSNSSLLAQLAANNKVPNRDNTKDWYKAYFEVLTHLGWIIDEHGFSEHLEKGADFEAHNAIIAVAATVFGSAATALTIITSTLNSLEKVGEGPWMTLFKRESQSAKAARFQVATAEPEADGGCRISFMAFELMAKNDLVQVLFFKFKKSTVSLRHDSGKITLDKAIATALAPTVADKVLPFSIDFIKNIPL